MVRGFSTEDYAVFFDLSLDWRVLTFTMLAATSAALLAGTAPAVRALRTEPIEALVDRRRERRRFSNAAVLVAQISLSFVLVVSAILLARTFSTLARMEPGFDRDRVLVVKVDVGAVEKTSDTRPAMYRAVVDAARGAVDVNAAAASKILPGDMIRLTPLIETPSQQTQTVASRVSANTITPGWFQTLGIPLTSDDNLPEEFSEFEFSPDQNARQVTEPVQLKRKSQKTGGIIIPNTSKVMRGVRGDLWVDRHRIVLVTDAPVRDRDELVMTEVQHAVLRLQKAFEKITVKKAQEFDCARRSSAGTLQNQSRQRLGISRGITPAGTPHAPQPIQLIGWRGVALNTPRPTRSAASPTDRR